MRTPAILFTTWLLSASFALAAGSVHVRGYTRKDGTYVAPHTRSAPRPRGFAMYVPVVPIPVPAPERPLPETKKRVDFPGASRIDKPPRTEPRTKSRVSVSHAYSDEEWEKISRDWKDTDGEVIATGRFLSLLGDSLWVKARDGKRTQIALTELSKGDLEYLDTRGFGDALSSVKR